MKSSNDIEHINCTPDALPGATHFLYLGKMGLAQLALKLVFPHSRFTHHLIYYFMTDTECI